MLLSVCIPTYNRKELLLRALQSAMVDSSEVEYIITDNSIDDTTELAVRSFFLGRRANWQYRRNNFESGLPGYHQMTLSMNAGVRMASGRFIYILHDDDYVLPGAVEGLLGVLRGPSANHAVIKFGVRLVELTGKVRRTERCLLPRYLSPRKALRAVLTDSSFARFPAMVFKREVYEKVGSWNLKAREAIDFDFYARAFREYGVMEYRSVLGCYSVHNGAQTMTVFCEGMVLHMLSLFDDADPDGLLSEREFTAARAKFIHQFLLGGTFRMMRMRGWRKAEAVYALFNMPEVRALGTPVKWAALKQITGVLLAVRRNLPVEIFRRPGPRARSEQ